MPAAGLAAPAGLKLVAGTRVCPSGAAGRAWKGEALGQHQGRAFQLNLLQFFRAKQPPPSSGGNSSFFLPHCNFSQLQNKILPEEGGCTRASAAPRSFLA